MPTKLTTVSVRLDDESGAQVEKAARLLRQSKGAFLARAGEEAARKLLLEWAAQRYLTGTASLSELAAETALAFEALGTYRLKVVYEKDGFKAVSNTVRVEVVP